MNKIYNRPVTEITMLMTGRLMNITPESGETGSGFGDPSLAPQRVF